MSQSSRNLATWPAPSWAASSDVDPSGNLVHSLPADVDLFDVGNTPIEISAEVADEFLADSPPAGFVRRGDATIRIGDLALTPSGALTLAGALTRLLAEIGERS